MPTISRLIKAPRENNYFLFGARGTGKSTLLENWYHVESANTSQQLYINLLDPFQEEDYQKNPNLIKEKLLADQRIQRVIIDEVQKVPKLLDVVHYCTEKFKKVQFILTGSSSRKLKRGGANLLAGRSFSLKLHPLTSLEAPNADNLMGMLQWGTLPKIYEYSSDADRLRFLRAYTNTYLREEVQLEQLVRNIERFRQFLELAAQFNGEVLNFSNIAIKSGLDEKTIARYFEILVDTMIGFTLEPFNESVRTRQSQKPKFYLFDTGVQRFLSQFSNAPLLAGTSEYGKLFEQFIILECLRLNDYFEKDYKFYFLRTKDGAEIDLIVQKNPHHKILIEIKSAGVVSNADYPHLVKLSDNIKHQGRWVLCNEKTARQTVDGVRILPWRQGLKELFSLPDDPQ